MQITEFHVSRYKGRFKKANADLRKTSLCKHIFQFLPGISKKMSVGISRKLEMMILRYIGQIGKSWQRVLQVAPVRGCHYQSPSGFQQVGQALNHVKGIYQVLHYLISENQIKPLPQFHLHKISTDELDIAFFITRCSIIEKRLAYIYCPDTMSLLCKLQCQGPLGTSNIQNV